MINIHKSHSDKVTKVQIKLQSCAKMFGKYMFFSFSGIYGLISRPNPISMLKNVISVLHELRSSMRGMGEEMGQNYRR